MTPLVLTDAEYEVLKKKLHQAHDKLIKLTLHEDEAIRELMDKIVMPLLKGVKINLDDLKLDNTAYIRPNLQVFFSDVVYKATFLDETTGMKEPAKIAILVEHKSDMPTELALRLQVSDYINAIMKKNYDRDTDKTISVIPIVFNQFDQDWKPQSFRSLFPGFSTIISCFIPEFAYLVINLASLSDEIMDSLNQYGILKASLLAMKHVRNKQFLKQHFEKIFLFLQEHPEKIDLRDQLIAYILGQSDISAQDLEELLTNIFSPVLKQDIMINGNGFIAVAARQAKAEAMVELKEAAALAVKADNERLIAATKKAAEKIAKKAQLEVKKAKELILKAQQETENAKAETENAKAETENVKAKTENVKAEAENVKAEALRVKTRLSVIRSLNRGLSIDLITDIVDVSPSEVRELIVAFENVKAYCHSKIDIDMKELMQLSGFNEQELNAVLILLQRY